MDNHRSRPVCNHAAFARGVLNEFHESARLATSLRGDSSAEMEALSRVKCLQLRTKR
jgi:hypothetical protein